MQPAKITMTDSDRLARCSTVLKAIRVSQWCKEWPSGHSDAPNRPRFVREFEDAHGEAPASAERVLREFDGRKEDQ